MTIPAIARPLVVLGRLVGLVGAALTVGAVSAMVVGWAYSAVRHAPDWNVGLLPVVLPLQLLVAGWVAWSTLVAEPRPLLRRLLVAAAGSFFALYGWYFLLAGGGMGLIAVGNLLYLVAGLVVGVAAMTSSTLGEEGDRAGFEVEHMWGYEYNSWGYGALRMMVVDERGKAPYDEEDAPSSPVGSTGGGEYAAGGTYRLEIDADDEANYEVLVCDGATQGNTGSAGRER